MIINCIIIFIFDKTIDNLGCMNEIWCFSIKKCYIGLVHVYINLLVYKLHVNKT